MAYYNILQKHSGVLMLGMSEDTKEACQFWIDGKYNNEETAKLNKKRWEYSRSPPLPLDDYEIVETDKLFTF